MGPDGVLRRIRWDNVARLLGLVALALLVVMWPRLGGRAPRLPPPTAVPLASAPPSPPRPPGAKPPRPPARGRAREREPRRPV
jgi:hypothetical protein